MERGAALQASHDPAAAALFEDLTVPWWVAGGWAIDLILG